MPRAAPRLERVILGAIPVTIFLFACGSSPVESLRSAGRPLRWCALLALLLLAAALVFARRRFPRPNAAHAIAVALVVVAAASTLWSVAPLLTAARTVSFAVLLATAAALASAIDPRRLLGAVLAGAVLVAAVGIVVYLLDHDSAVQAATTGAPARFRGLGENPNTVPMLFAIALPISTLFALAAETPLRRVSGAAAFLFVAGSIVASGSRGGLVAGFAGSLVVAALIPRSLRRRTTGGALVAVLFLAAVAIMAIPDPLAPSGATSPPATPSFPRNADLGLRLEDDVGRPRGVAQPQRRSLLGLSGRDEAWRAGIDSGLERPVAGYGFGTEDRVFVDRLYTFQGGRPEQSFVGMFMQLGIVGLLLLLGLLLALGVACIRVVASSDPHLRAVGVAGLAALVSTLALCLVQSFVYAAGNISALSAWISLFLPASVARGSLPRISLPRRVAPAAAGLAALLAVCLVVGRWEGRRHARAEVEAMARIRAVVGPLDTPAPAAYRVGVGKANLSCLLYRRGVNPYALELCFDADGRLVEAIDRRGVDPRIASLREEPAASTIRVDPRLVRMLLSGLGAPL